MSYINSITTLQIDFSAAMGPSCSHHCDWWLFCVGCVGLRPLFVVFGCFFLFPVLSDLGVGGYAFNFWQGEVHVNPTLDVLVCFGVLIATMSCNYRFFARSSDLFCPIYLSLTGPSLWAESATLEEKKLFAKKVGFCLSSKLSTQLYFRVRWNQPAFSTLSLQKENKASEPSLLETRQTQTFSPTMQLLQKEIISRPSEASRCHLLFLLNIILYAHTLFPYTAFGATGVTETPKTFRKSNDLTFCALTLIWSLIPSLYWNNEVVHTMDDYEHDLQMSDQDELDLWEDEAAVVTTNMPEELWMDGDARMDGDAKHPPPEPSSHIDRFADDVELKRLCRMGVLVKWILWRGGRQAGH